MIFLALFAAAISPTQVATFTNGLEVVGVRIPGASSFSVQAFVRTGSAYESKETNGVNHLLEHMLFRRGKADSIAENAGALLNATTYREMTRFFCEGPTSAWQEGLRSVATILERPSLTDLTIETGVVAEESALRYIRSSALIDDLLWGSFGAGSAWSLSAIGDMGAVKAAKAATLQAIYDRAYVGGNIVVAAVGDFEPAFAIEHAKKLFAKVPAGARSMGAPPLPTFTPGKVAAAIGGSWVAIGLHAPGFDTPESYICHEMAFDLLAGVGGLASQEGLEREVFFGPSERGSLATLVFRLETTGDVEATVRGVLGKLAKGPTSTEFEELKLSLEARYRAHDRSPSDKAMLVGLARLFAGSEIDWRAIVKDTTLAKIQFVCKKFAPDQLLMMAGR
ncbi:MAG: M16 family metallopeptidase [Fimbriimonadales bacterium]